MQHFDLTEMAGIHQRKAVLYSIETNNGLLFVTPYISIDGVVTKEEPFVFSCKESAENFIDTYSYHPHLACITYRFENETLHKAIYGYPYLIDYSL